MKKNVIGINVTAKDAKKIVELAGLLAQIFTPTEETPVAVITEAAPKKAVAKKATKKAAKTEAPTEKPTKKTKKTSLKKVTVSTKHRITLPRTYLDATGAREWGSVDVLRKYGRDDAVYFIRNGASYNTKKYGYVKTASVDLNGQVSVGRLLKGLSQGDEVKVDLRGDKIIVRM